MLNNERKHSVKLNIIPSKLYKKIIIALNVLVIVSAIMLNSGYIAALLIVVALGYSAILWQENTAHSLTITPDGYEFDGAELSTLSVAHHNPWYLVLRYTTLLQRTQTLVLFNDSITDGDIKDLVRKLYV